MKKLVNGKKRTQMILIVIVAMLIFNFMIPNYSQAGLGGVLAKPFTDFFALIGDAITAGLQSFLVDGDFIKGNLLTNAFLISSEKQTSCGVYPKEYADINYNTTSGVTEHVFYMDDFDEEGPDLFNIKGSIAIPVTRYTPDSIFAGLVPAFDINFIDPTDWTEEKDDNNKQQFDTDVAEAMNERSIARKLHENIATWYVALRNLAIVGLMVILVYVGIRIVISSTASDKAKYKQMMMDWLVAMCILFCLHYIMSFTVTITKEINGAITGGKSTANVIPVTVYDGSSENPGNTPQVQFNTTITGLARFQSKLADMGSKILYTIIYLALVIYTCMFTFTYLKRTITMAFLTLISPLVALTYPIDKMNDGKAQAFNSWLKEYVFNALLQPFHLIIYTVFVSTAMNLAATNPIYAIVTLAFITPAEKILRKFFGFEKASTAGALGAAAGIAGGAAFMNIAKGIMAPKKGGGGSGGKGIKTKGIKGSTPSVGDAFGGGTSGKLDNNNSGATALDSANQKDKDNLAKSENAEALDELPAAASTEGMHQTDSGFYVPDRVPESDLTLGSNPSSSTDLEKETNGIHGAHGFEWTDDDTRGAGQYLGDAAKHGAAWIGANTGIGRGAVKFGRKVGARATKVRDIAKSKAQKAGDLGRRIVPKPFRNSARTIGGVAKGVGNVALQTGLSVGKAALKAAPGAMVGLAAGIAGDDLGDIMKYTAAGAALSSTIGSSSLAQAGSFVADTYNQGAHGSIEGQLEQRRRNFEKNESNQLLASSMFPNASKAEIKKKMRQASYYDSVGIEGKDAFKAAKLEDQLREKLMEKEGKNENDAAKLAQKQAAVIADIAQDYSKKDLKDKSEVMNLRNDLTTKLDKAGLKGKELSSTVENLVAEVKSFKKVSNNY